MAEFLMSHLDDRVAERFYAKVRETQDCHLWTKAVDRKGYGRFGIGQPTRTFFAHRVAIALAGVVPPDGLMVCHSCDNPPCVRPDHLFVGTHEDNMLDWRKKGYRSGALCCSHGHPWTEANTQWYLWEKNGYYLRRCRACERERYRSRKGNRGQ
jgi:hypothetical protein